MILTKKCPHGKLLTQPCLACEKMDKVERHTAQKIANLAAENEQLREALEQLLPILKQKAATGACIHDTLYGNSWQELYDSANAAIAKVGE